MLGSSVLSCSDGGHPAATQNLCASILYIWMEEVGLQYTVNQEVGLWYTAESGSSFS